MGGDISVKSHPGNGTTFTVDLPSEVSPLSSGTGAAAAPAEAAASTARRVVLVIDDDADASDLLRRNLVKAGYDVLTAHDGETGIEIARRMKPAAITLDAVMPGMDGWAVLTKLKADPETAAIPVIMVTMTRDSEMGYSLGAAEFLTKPVDPTRLGDVLKRHCQSAAAPVLIVDDEPLNRELLARMLEREGYQTVEAVNGSDALEKIAIAAPSLILLDLMMPVMDGFAFLSALRRSPAFADVPVVIVTAKDLTDNDRALLRGSVEQILEKGAINRERLLREIGQLIAKSTRH